MRLGLLAYGLDRPLTGIGRYTVELARALARVEPKPDLTLLTAGEPVALGDANGYARVPLRGCRLLPALITLGNVLIPYASRRAHLQVIHDPTGVTPFLFGAGEARVVVTIHDVFAWSHPGASALLDTVIYRHWLPRLVKKANAIITVSSVSCRDIHQYLGVTMSKINIIPYGIGPQFRLQPVEQARGHVLKRFGIVRPYILFVGSLTLRKNIERGLRAFYRLRPQFPELRFILAGPRSWKQTPVEAIVQELDLASVVQMTGPLTDTDLPALYSAADLFVFPSLYEGFGLPPLEAMACGTPVVCSNSSSLPEVVGDAAVMVDPYDVEALAQAMHRVLTDSVVRDEMRAKGLARAAQFTWERTAQETLKVYQAVLDGTS